DGEHDAELFWALRGAGAGNFGVATELIFRPVPAPVVTVFHLAWPFSQAAAVTRAWLAWAGTAPDQIAASLSLAAGQDPANPPTAEVVRDHARTPARSNRAPGTAQRTGFPPARRQPAAGDALP